MPPVEFSLSGSGITPFISTHYPNIPDAGEFPPKVFGGNPVIIVNPEDTSVSTARQTSQTNLTANVRARIDRGLEGRRAISFTNTSSTSIVYIGGSDITVGTGHALPPYGQIAFDMKEVIRWWAISSVNLTVTAIEVA